MIIKNLKNFVSLCLLLLISNCILAQEVFTGTKNVRARNHYENSSDFMIKREYEKAELLLSRAISLDSLYIDAHMRLASIYSMTRQTDKEIAVYQTLIRLRPDYPIPYYNYGIMLMEKGNFEYAKKSFNTFLSFDNQDEKYRTKASEKLEICEFRYQWKKNPVPFKPENLGQAINTELDEYWPVLTADDQSFYFTRKLIRFKDPQGRYILYNEDIFVSELDSADWFPARKLPGNINTENNEGAISISPDGKFLLYTICSEEKYLRDFYGSCDIYISEFKNGEWQKASNIGPPVNTRYKETQPSISFDGKSIYFSSNRRGTLGGLDIWKSTKDSNGYWSEPVNLGPEINTKHNEQSPFIHPDDKTLFFSTEGFNGMGGSDLFFAKKDDQGNFGEITNLGYPINTEDNEIGLFVNARGNKGFFSSRRPGGSGGLDIYVFDLHESIQPDPVCYLKGRISDKESKKTLEATLELIDLSTGKTVLLSESDRKTGAYLAAIPSDRNYMLNVSCKGYLFYSDHLPIKGIASSSYIKDIEMVPVKEGEKLILNNIFFEFDSYLLKQESKAELNKLVAFMNEYPGLKVEIGGHTDDRGSDEYNKILSENRAIAVRDFLIQKGNIDPQRLSTKGYGASQPIESNDSEEGRARNRRTEFLILSL
jgi:outer membrane protein OmpA-like peptidoglycan-associated protein/tetratricopeptide (TPR) repeat protein